MMALTDQINGFESSSTFAVYLMSYVDYKKTVYIVYILKFFSLFQTNHGSNYIPIIS
jgi:hypothetical protein